MPSHACWLANHRSIRNRSRLLNSDDVVGKASKFWSMHNPSTSATCICYFSDISLFGLFARLIILTKTVNSSKFMFYARNVTGHQYHHQATVFLASRRVGRCGLDSRRLQTAADKSLKKLDYSVAAGQKVSEIQFASQTPRDENDLSADCSDCPRSSQTAADSIHTTRRARRRDRFVASGRPV